MWIKGFHGQVLILLTRPQCGVLDPHLIDTFLVTDQHSIDTRSHLIEGSVSAQVNISKVIQQIYDKPLTDL